jgi:hypothetical protein
VHPAAALVLILFVLGSWIVFAGLCIWAISRLLRGACRAVRAYRLKRRERAEQTEKDRTGAQIATRLSSRPEGD